MKDQAAGWLKKIWGDFTSFSPGQKAVTIVAVAALIIGGILFASWKSSPTYAPLYSNLSTTDAAAVVDNLNENGIPYQLAAGGTQILVPQDKVYDTRLTLSSDGLPGSTSGGYALLDQEGITTSEFKQQVDYQRAIEGELAKTIESLDGVRGATVHLAIPKQDVFNDGTKKTTAAVMLSLAPGATLTSSQVQSVVYLVSSSVPELAADEVTVADSQGHVLAAPGDGLTGIGGSDTRAQMTQDYNARLTSALQTMLDKAVGPGHSVVTVNADLDFDHTSTTTQSYTYEPDTPPVWSEESTENYQGTQGDGGVFGTGEADVDTAAGDSDGSYEKSNKTVTNALGTVTQTVQNTPGAVKKLSVAVLLDKTDQAIDQAGITALVSSAVGLNTDRGDTLAIQSMAFDDSAGDAAAAADAAAAKAAADKASQQRLQNWIKQGALAGVILLVLIITWIASRRRKRAAERQRDEELDLLTHRIPEGALLAPAPVETAAAPESTTDSGAGRRALVALADEQPDDVARVLSGWLNTADTKKEGATR